MVIMEREDTSPSAPEKILVPVPVLLVPEPEPEPLFHVPELKPVPEPVLFVPDEEVKIDMVIIEKIDTSPPAPEDMADFLILRDRSMIMGDLRETWFFDWTSTDLYLIIDAPCSDLECVKKRIEYYKDNFQLEPYEDVMRQANQQPWNPYVIPTAKHRYYALLIGDLMTIVQTFGSSRQLGLWETALSEYLSENRDYADEVAQDPIGFAVKQTITPIVEVGADVVQIVAEPIIKATVDIAKSVTTNLVESIFGKDWKTKLGIGLAVIIVIAVVGLIGYQYSKTFITEKAKKKAK